MIPRIIHQTFPTAELPAPLQANVDNLKALNPGWEHRLYDDRAVEFFIARHYAASVLAAYRRIDPRYGAARADLFRHLVLFKHGGVYCDIKSGFSKPLDDVLQPSDCYVISQWTNGWEALQRDLAHVCGGEFVNYFLIAEPGHPFTSAAIERILKNVACYRPWHPVGRNGVFRTTGPIAYTLAVHPLLDRHPHRFASPDELGAYYSIGDGYDHKAALPHYSLVRAPVAKLGPVGACVSRAFTKLRELKAGWTGS